MCGIGVLADALLLHGATGGWAAMLVGHLGVFVVDGESAENIGEGGGLRGTFRLLMRIFGMLLGVRLLLATGVLLLFDARFWRIVDHRRGVLG